MSSVDSWNALIILVIDSETVPWPILSAKPMYLPKILPPPAHHKKQSRRSHAFILLPFADPVIV